MFKCKCLFFTFVSSLLIFGSMHLIYPCHVHSKSLYSDGAVDNSSGTTNSALTFEDFNVTEDGSITGHINNISSREMKKLRLDMWITNINNTRIFYRKVIDLGDMGPNSRVEVKEKFKPGEFEDLADVKFYFKIPSAGNFRNKCECGLGK